LAAAIPSRCRSSTISRSNSAIDPTILRNSRPGIDAHPDYRTGPRAWQQLNWRYAGIPRLRRPARCYGRPSLPS
jgi:hypothetical protein